MNKSYNNTVNSKENEITEEELELINGYSQKKLGAEEIFTFSVVLCDNEIDRDFERFSVDSLNRLAELFVGKTAIKNHSCNSDDQSARTYKTEVITDPEKKNSLGEPYTFLKARCYMPRLKKNEDFIKEIEAGIKKEVSIGCSVRSSVCSICGNDRRTGACHHKKGRVYKGRLCYDELTEPYDAYEWSFVAVPAQKNAGVTKGFNNKTEENMENVTDIIKGRIPGEAITLSGKQADELAAYLDELMKKASDGETYRRQLEADTVVMFARSVPVLSDLSAQSICRSLETEDLKKLYQALCEKQKATVIPELFTEKEPDKAAVNQFRL